MLNSYLECYSCKRPLVPKHLANEEQILKGHHASEEHIIPNILGGVEKSSALLCKSCNNDFNKDFEMKFQKEFILPKLFKFDLERRQQRLTGLRALNIKTQEEVVVYGNTWRPFKTSIQFDDQGSLIYFAGTRKELELHISNRIRRNQPINIDVSSLFSNPKNIERLPPIDVSFENLSFGSVSTYKTITKIAINFYLFNGGNRSHISKIIEYLKSKCSNQYTCFYYPKLGTDIIHHLEEKEISHLIFLKGTNRWGLLYCYIELFNTANFVVILDDNYKGPNIEHTYCYDVLLNERKNKGINFNLLRNPIYTYNNKNIDNHIQPCFSKNLSRLIEIINTMHISED